MEKDIGKINKNDMADIVLRIDDFGNRRGLTIREFITSDRYTGFTKSGVKILAADFPKFKEMINSIPEEDMTQPENEESETKEQLPPEQKTLKQTKGKSGKKAEEDLPDY